MPASGATKVVVIGGDAAGMSAASVAKRRAGEGVDVVVFEQGELTSYALCGLPYFVAGMVDDPDALVARTPAQHRANGIDVRTGHEVRRIDVAAREVEVLVGAEGTVVREPYDRLVIATGAAPVWPPFPGIDARGVTGVHSIPDALAIDALLRDRDARRAVVVGGGYIGLEMVEAFLARGLEVTLVEKVSQPMATLDADMAARVSDALRELDVDLRLGVGVEGFETGPDGWVTAVATEAGTVAADVVLLGLGVRPRVDLARAAGIVVGPSGAIATDGHLRTSVPDVYAAGDCAESRHRVTGRPVSIALGTHANQQGRVVGENLAGGDATFPGVLGTAVTKVCDTEIARTGLSEREAAEAGIDAVAETTEGRTRAGYYPGAAPAAVKVVVARAPGRMLGAQIVGGPGAAKRIDAFAVGVWNEMTVHEFSQVDLGYAPPFAAPIDVSLVAARRAGHRRETDEPS
ncbi:MAG: FAD-dependent oxidoreductase [Acidimicrobiia bacterium]